MLYKFLKTVGNDVAEWENTYSPKTGIRFVISMRSLHFFGV
jgi:hypothetical protein